MKSVQIVAKLKSVSQTVNPMIGNNLAMAFVITLVKEFVLTIQGIVLEYLMLVMAEKKMLVNALLHLKIHHSTSRE